jgi:hypothetical protein
MVDPEQFYAPVDWMNVFAQIGIIAIWFGLCGIPAWWHWKKFGYSWYGEPWLPPPKTSFDQEPELPRKWWLAGPRVEGPFYGVWAWYIFASMIFFTVVLTIREMLRVA